MPAPGEKPLKSRESLVRCPWCMSFDEYIRYHDEEWGVPVHDDRVHFEFLILEGAQAGLSWASILKRREGYRKLFAEFDPAVVARFTEKRLEKILLDPRIIRNRLKVLSAKTNAVRFLEVQKEFGSFDAYIWNFVGGAPIVNAWKTIGQVPASNASSDALSKDMKKRGFKFAGSTILYAHMQACGLVNDHLVDCFRYSEPQRQSR